MSESTMSPSSSPSSPSSPSPSASSSDGVGPVPFFEEVPCPLCHSRARDPFISAEDDLTGKPGRFTFVTCRDCGLRYQNPRVSFAHIGAFYDHEYLAHRKKTDWGLLTPFYEHAMGKHDRDKLDIVARHLRLTPTHVVLDVGCAVGTFLELARRRTGCQTIGVDFKDLSAAASLQGTEFHHGTFPEAPIGDGRCDLVTMWHFLEHDYDQQASLQKARSVMKDDGLLIVEVPRLDSASFRLYGDRWPGLQAPQHTVLFDKQTLVRMVEEAGFHVVEWLPWGAFPAYFYLFAGAAFTVLKGKGLDLDRVVAPYFVGQVLTTPIRLFEKQLNLAMQTVVCRKRR